MGQPVDEGGDGGGVGQVGPPLLVGEVRGHEEGGPLVAAADNLEEEIGRAVKTQVWIAISVYVLVALVKKDLKLERSLAEIFQILSLRLFETNELSQVLTATNPQNPAPLSSNHLDLLIFNRTAVGRAERLLAVNEWHLQSIAGYEM